MATGQPDSEPFPVLPGFEVVRKIGKGGMGEVYEAVRVGAGGFRKPVAVKTLNWGAHPGPKALERFLRECRVTARFEHPNIVRVHDLLSIGEQHFLVMELLSGVDASALRGLYREGAPAWVALSVAVQALEGLAYAHAMADEEGRPLGLVHRDLTPRNLFLCDSGVVKILDFGLARVDDVDGETLTAAGMVAGTPGYMSPEQANGHPLDGRSDVFQLGASIYWMLTGHSPYGNGPREERLERAAKGAVIRPLREARPDLPADTVALVERAMTPDLAQRFANAREMLEAVGQALQDVTHGAGGLSEVVANVRANEVTVSERATPTPGKLPAVAAAPPAVERRGRTEVLPPPFEPTSESHGTPSATPAPVRYQVLRLLGRGGMGAVYEAEDLELGERVALKTLRPELAADAEAVERFKRELLLAHRVTHPNVCRLFDLGFSPGPLVPDEPASGWRTVFITMELLQGETLAVLVRRRGRLSTREALPIAVQLASGLAAAHRAGVVHGDFKSDNVVIEPPRTAHPEGRAVITDFGLARAAGHSGDDLGTQILVGTPAYIAPEQVDGSGALTAAADLYSLGVVLYEMVTGELPFKGQTAAEVARMRLNVSPPKPSSKVPGLDPAWDAVILRCLEREPARRFGDAEEVARALGSAGAPASAPRRRGRRWVVPAALGIAAALLVLGGGVALRAQRAKAFVRAPAGARRSVAVLGFRNLSGRLETAWLSTALAETLKAELDADGVLRTIPGEEVARAAAELALSGTDELGPQRIQRFGQDLGADFVLTGSYLSLGEKADGKLRLNLQLYDSSRGDAVAKVGQTGTEAELLELVTKAGAALRDEAGLSRLAPEKASGLASAFPAGREAARLYAEGLALLRASDFPAAREKLELAAAADPKQPRVYVALSQAWRSLGYKQKALESARRARELATGLSEEERLGLDGLTAAAAENWAQAIEAYRARWRLAPDNLDYGLALGAAQNSAGGPVEPVYETVRALRALPGPASEDPRIDLLEATTASRTSDPERLQQAAARGAERAERLGARILVGRARQLEAWALMLRGNTAGALVAYEDSRRICDAVGYRDCVAKALEGIGILRGSMGELKEARAVLEKALALRREMGMESQQASALTNLAGVLVAQGDLAGARKADEAALEIGRRLGIKEGIGYALANLAPLLYEAGEWDAAVKASEEALAIFREIRETRAAGAVMIGLADGLLAQGRLAQASERFDEALELLRRNGVKDMLDQALSDQARLQAQRGDVALARKTYGQALDAAAALGAQGNVASIHLGLAQLALAEGSAQEAETLARQALDVFVAEKAPVWEVEARGVLAVALAARGKVAEAKAQVDAAEPLTAQVASPRTLVKLRIAQARVEAAAGHAKPAVRSLTAELPKILALGDVLIEHEARLALGQLELASGNKAGKQRLAALAKEADAKGLKLNARRATAAMRAGR